MAEPAKKRVAKPVKKVTRTVHTRAKTGLEGFVDFIRTQGVVGLAIGFVIGVQAKALIDQFTASFVNPLLGLIIGGNQALSKKTLYLQLNSRSATFEWGAFVFAIINFIIIAAVIYYTFKWLRLDKLDKKKG